MRWKANDEIFILILVSASEGSWIILCNNAKVLCHLFWANSAFGSVLGLKPMSWVPTWLPQTLGRPLSLVNLVAAAYYGLSFV